MTPDRYITHKWRPVGSREDRGYGTAWIRIRKAILKREPNCRACAKEGRETKALHLDHIKPKCLGGTDDLSNLQPLCLAHSRSKTGREGAYMRVARRRAREKLAACDG